MGAVPARTDFQLDLALTAIFLEPSQLNDVSANACTSEEIVDALRQFKLNAIADRLADLQKLIEDDSERSVAVDVIESTERQPQIENACTPEEIVDALRQFKLNAIADRLADLQKMVEDDPEEPPMQLESLRSLAIFLIREIHPRQLPEPGIGVTPDGLLEIAWSLPPHNGMLAMDFLPAGQIQYTAISAPAQSGVERKTASGISTRDEIMKNVQSFISLLERPCLHE